ncbi:MAG: hypothetical protein H0U46_03135 [Actinobacteria bacterium]|nr:hypothetical protein [Actinomycetota bacterium]
MTKSDLTRQEDAVNSMLASRGSSARVFVQGRNGYTGLDLLDAKDGGTVKTLTAGSKSDVELYLLGMKEAFWLLEEPYVHHISEGGDR